MEVNFLMLGGACLHVGESARLALFLDADDEGNQGEGGAEREGNQGCP